jgi:hypothetical protein
LTKTVPAELSSTIIQSKPEQKILTVRDCCEKDITQLLFKYQLTLSILKDPDINTPIPGSFWGDSEAGLIGNTVFVRNDTPIHSLLHETCHYICMDEIRRKDIDTNAEGGYDEENAVCYLQILLANDLSEMTSYRMMQDMDSWGYTFRLGYAKAWFENDAEDALAWLQHYNLLNSENKPNYSLRTS